jgi:hypothetical protein
MVMHFLLGTGADFIGLERTLAIISIAAAGGALIAGRRLERVVNVTESAN